MPMVENFKLIIKMIAIKNCPVTIEDINLAEKIFGPDISSLKGKSTRTKVATVTNDHIEIPEEIYQLYQELELCMDIMFVNGMPMLTTVDRTIKFRGLVPLNNRKEKEIFRGLDVILRYYNQAGFRIVKLHCDNEFRNMLEKIQDDLGIKMNFTNAGDHVPEAERNNRTIKERIRAGYHRLP